MQLSRSTASTEPAGFTTSSNCGFPSTVPNWSSNRGVWRWPSPVPPSGWASERRRLEPELAHTHQSLLTLASRGERLGLLMTSSIPARCFWGYQRTEMVNTPRLADSSDADVLSLRQLRAVRGFPSRCAFRVNSRCDAARYSLWCPGKYVVPALHKRCGQPTTAPGRTALSPAHGRIFRCRPVRIFRTLSTLSVRNFRTRIEFVYCRVRALSASGAVTVLPPSFQPVIPEFRCRFHQIPEVLLGSPHAGVADKRTGRHVLVQPSLRHATHTGRAPFFVNQPHTLLLFLNPAPQAHDGSATDSSVNAASACPG